MADGNNSDDNGNKMIPFNEIQNSGVDLNLAINQFQNTTELLGQMGIVSATFDSGMVFNKNAHTTTLAIDGLIVQQGHHSTTIIMRNEGSTELDALNEVQSSKLTQETLGAFSGHSQSWVSLNSETDE